MVIKCTVDARRLRCPAPLLKAREGLHSVAIGECVEVLTTDTSSVRDFHRFIELTNHKMVLFETVERDYRYVLEKGK